MFGMTKRQFLKRSKKCLNETCDSLLLFRQILNEELQGKIGNREASTKLDILRRNLETTFSEFEKLNPPSKCFSLYHRILSALIKLHEAVVINLESLTAAEKGLEEESREKLTESIGDLEEFREDFNGLVKEVGVFLAEK